MSGQFAGRCPLCGVAWRGATECRRCGTDLGPVMRVAIAAWTLREKARGEILGGMPHAALSTLAAAQKLQRCDEGQRLRKVAAWLAEGAIRDR